MSLEVYVLFFAITMSQVMNGSSLLDMDTHLLCGFHYNSLVLDGADPVRHCGTSLEWHGVQDTPGFGVLRVKRTHQLLHSGSDNH